VRAVPRLWRVIPWHLPYNWGKNTNNWGKSTKRATLKDNVENRLKRENIQPIAFHPESQGSIERSHRVLAEYLRHYVKEDQTNWDEWVPFAAYAYNTSEHSATGYTPFELVFGHPSSLPSALKSEPSPNTTMTITCLNWRDVYRPLTM
jgi:hypothetical protein